MNWTGLLLAATLISQDPRAIIGRWLGSSICVKAAWNSACNDEQVIYDVVAGTDQNHVTMNASKLVNGIAESMFDQPLVYDSTTQQWNGDFENSRVKIRWSFRVAGDSLAGEVTLLPSGNIGRHVSATRR